MHGRRRVVGRRHGGTRRFGTVNGGWTTPARGRVDAHDRAMATRRRYFDDSYAFESRSRGATRRASDGDGADDVVVVLDETIAYPAGGGQPCDRGDESATGATFMFERVRGLADGMIEHG